MSLLSLSLKHCLQLSSNPVLHCTYFQYIQTTPTKWDNVIILLPSNNMLTIMNSLFYKYHTWVHKITTLVLHFSSCSMSKGANLCIHYYQYIYIYIYILSLDSSWRICTVELYSMFDSPDQQFLVPLLDLIFYTLTSLLHHIPYHIISHPSLTARTPFE